MQPRMGWKAVTRETRHPTPSRMRERGTSPGMCMVLDWFHPLLEQFLSLHPTVETTSCFGVFFALLTHVPQASLVNLGL